jgi:hypothetical protein
MSDYDIFLLKKNNFLWFYFLFKTREADLLQFIVEIIA